MCSSFCGWIRSHCHLFPWSEGSLEKIEKATFPSTRYKEEVAKSLHKLGGLFETLLIITCNLIHKLTLADDMQGDICKTEFF